MKRGGSPLDKKKDVVKKGTAMELICLIFRLIIYKGHLICKKMPPLLHAAGCCSTSTMEVHND